MVTNIIIAVSLIFIVSGEVIILKRKQKERLIRIVDKVFELLINPSIKSFCIHEGVVRIEIKKDEFQYWDSVDFYLTKWYRLEIINEPEVGITGLTKLKICLIDRNKNSLYDKYIEINRWK